MWVGRCGSSGQSRTNRHGAERANSGRGDDSHTHHTNLDTFERIVWDDAMKAAVISASVVYHLAMRDEALPRFSPETMPGAPQGR